MPLAEKGAWGKGRQPLSPPQHTVTRSAISAPNIFQQSERSIPHSRRAVTVAFAVSTKILSWSFSVESLLSFI